MLLPTTTTVTIANGASLSAAINLAGEGVLSIRMPAAWTTANLTFQASTDGTTYNDVYDEFGTEYTVTAAASRHILVDPSKFAGATYLKVRSGTTGTPVNQGADRSLVLSSRQLW